MSAARKKVIVRELGGQLHWGYLPAHGFSGAEPVDFLLVDGKAKPLNSNAIKHIAYVRDFNMDEPEQPEGLRQRTFISKPRSGGLWIRIQFLTGDTIEGLATNAKGLLDTIAEEQGLFFEPPDRGGNTLRLFVPRSAIAAFEIVGIAGRATSTRHRSIVAVQPQGNLFGSDAS